MTRVLVTGGAGFIGSHIVDHLLDHGYDVTVVDNLTDQVHDGEPDYLNADAEYVWGDIRDRELMADLLCETDVLCHHASAVSVGQSMYEIEEYVEVNTLATARLLDIIVSEEIELEKLVVASSMANYGEGQYFCPDCGEGRTPTLRSDEQMAQGDWDHHCSTCGESLEARPTPEAKKLDCMSVYGITKKDQEELFLSIGRAYDIPAVALRYFNVYGSRQSFDNPYTGVLATFSNRIQNGNPPVIYEDGEQKRDFVHATDVARANRLAIERDVAGVAINVASGEPTTVNEVAAMLIDCYGEADDLTSEITGDYRQGDVRHCFADTTRAEELLGFEPEMGLEEGLAELVEWGRTQDAEDSFEQARAELEEKGLLE